MHESRNTTAITSLSQDVVRKIESSIVITSLNDAVGGLIKNSLDAAADKLKISVDYTRGCCTVEDNGDGIPLAEFQECGGLGKLHHTSRHVDENVHGSNGEFLASLATFSLTTIISKHRSCTSQNSLSIHNSRVLARDTPAPSEQRLYTFDHGTRVSVRDLFGSMPVRVRQRPSSTDKSTLDKEFQRLVHSVVAILLAWPTHVCAVLQNSVTHTEVRVRRPAGIATGDPSLSYRVPATLVQSGLADENSYGTWVPVGASAKEFAVHGQVSLNAVATRRAQFLSMGIQPITKGFGFDILYDEINKVFASSDFAFVEAQKGNGVCEEPTSRDAKLKRGFGRWPMFYMRIEWNPKRTTKGAETYMALEKANNLAKIIDLLKTICFQFLKKHNFRPHSLSSSGTRSFQQTKLKSSGTANLDTASVKTQRATRKRPRLKTPVPRLESPFDTWQKVKIGKSSIPNSSRADAAPGIAKTQTQQPQACTMDKSGALLQKPFGDVEPSAKPSQCDSGDHTAEAEPDRDIASSASGFEDFTVDELESLLDTMRDEPSAPIPISSRPQQKNAKAIPSKFFADRITLEDRPSKSEPSGWLKGILSSWANPVFETVETGIPRLEEVIPAAGVDTRHAGNLCAGESAFDLSAIKLEGRVSKTALADAEIVAQVDKKFILAKVRREESRPDVTHLEADRSFLVIIDQHAADERCCLEDLMQDYFHQADAASHLRARTGSLETPVAFEFDWREYELLRIYTSHFQHWGIYYKLQGAGAGAGKSLGQPQGLPRVEITSLPPSIAERGKDEPSLLANLLRAEIWKLEEGSSIMPHGTRTAGQPPGDWVSNFHGCPQGILDMLNSRACRSAIMFNDVLSTDECADLVRRLSRCAFPFQCAHGRPSLVPLLDLRGFSGLLRGRAMQGQTADFRDRLRKWQAMP